MALGSYDEVRSWARVTDAMPVKHASRYDYQRLLDIGYEVFEYHADDDAYQGDGH